MVATHDQPINHGPKEISRSNMALTLSVDIPVPSYRASTLLMGGPVNNAPGPAGIISQGPDPQFCLARM